MQLLTVWRNAQTVSQRHLLPNQNQRHLAFQLCFLRRQCHLVFYLQIIFVYYSVTFSFLLLKQEARIQL
jgi:hypothetical protein